MILLPKNYYPTKWYVIDDIAYRKSGYFGCQLESYQWRKPQKGEHRFLGTWRIELYSAQRYPFRYRCTWCLPKDHVPFKEYAEMIPEFYDYLDKIQ